MGQRNPEEQIAHQIKQKDGRTGKQNPQRAVEKTDLSLQIERASGIIPYIQVELAVYQKSYQIFNDSDRDSA